MINTRNAGLLLGLGILGTLAIAPASAQVQINEFFINPPDAAGDNGLEFFELQSTSPSFSLTGLTLVIIEGDGAGAGTIDAAINLSTFSTGTNGLFLRRDSATVLNPAPAAATTLNVADFNPDIENGTNTYLLVSGFTGTVTNDLDSTNDGILDSTPWTSVLDGFSFNDTDNLANDRQYAGQVGGVNFTGLSFAPDAYYRTSDGKRVGMDVLGTSPGPYNSDPLETFVFGQGTVNYNIQLSPGNLNAVPAPSSVAVMALGGLMPLVAIARRRRAAK